MKNIQYIGFAITLLALQSIFSTRSTAATVINFEDLTLGQYGYTSVDYQYSPQFGIIFRDATAVDDGGSAFAHSGHIYIEPCFGQEFCSIPLGMDFRAAQTRVKVWVGYGNTLNNSQVVVLRAFTATGGAGTEVGHATGTLAPSSGVAPIRLPLEVNGVNILSATVEFINSEGQSPTIFNNSLGVDDVEFDGATALPCTDAPTVAIFSPGDGTQVDASQVTVAGIVSGDNLPTQGRLTITSTHPPPNDLTPPNVYAVPLSGSGSTRTFSQAGSLNRGLNTITFEAHNDCGYSGKSSVQILNLPGAIATRYQQEGGQSVVGNLQWVLNKGCTVAVYDHMAIATLGNSTVIIRPPILPKWIDWVSQPYHETEPGFCPLGEAVTLNSPWVGQGVYQDFGTGTIYGPNGVAIASYFVPKLFEDGRRQLRSITDPSVPLGDPLSSPAAHTTLFQKFGRIDVGDNAFLQSVWELKGDPPNLWFEDQVAPAASFSRSFGCADLYGPCAVPLSLFDLLPPIPNGKDASICGGCALCSGQEWEPVFGRGTGDHILTPVFGVLKDSHRAGEDNGFVHRCWYNDVDGRIYSDWNWIVQPLREYINIIPYDMRDEYSATTFEAEEEICDLGYFSYDCLRLGLVPNSLLFLCGRWIVDCGHSVSFPFETGPFAGEIHPPAIVGCMTTTYAGGQPRMDATLHANGFYTGAPVDITLFPPPRPAPNAFLSITKTQDSYATAGINISYDIDPDWSSQVTVHLSAPMRSPTVLAGVMYPVDDRGYYAKWSLGWAVDPGYNVYRFAY